MLVWPSLPQVDAAARAWAARQGQAHEDVLAIGYFGSYARRDHGPGSDLDLIAIVSASARPFVERASGWELSGLPVPADLLVYTADEWDRLLAGGGRFARTLLTDTVWMTGTPPAP